MVMQSLSQRKDTLHVFVSMNKLLNKWFSYQWSEAELSW